MIKAIHTSGKYIQVIVGSASTYVNASPDAEAAIDWVQRQMTEEKRLKTLAKEHPAVADALEAVEQAQEQVRIVAALVQE
jgi:maltose-binding protein MalE